MSATISEPIDPTKTARYNVRLGEGLLAEEGSTASNYSTVICTDTQFRMHSIIVSAQPLTTLAPDNHRPALPAESSTTTTIFPSDSTPGLYDLKLENQNNPRDIYTFQGSGSSASESYALIYDPETDEWILDRVDANFVFNLTSTPSNTDADDLAAKYPQLELDLQPEIENDHAGSDCGEFEGEGEVEVEGEDMFETAIDDDDAPADDDNPYDWRHFVAISPTRSRSASPLPSGSVSDESLILDLDDEAEADLPPFNSSSPIATPTPSRPSRPKPKAKPKPKPRSRRLTTPPPPPKDEDADNEASDADADADDGVLTIEMDPETRPRRHLGAELVRPASAAPISLRSAASSVSPRPSGRKADSEGEDEARGESESELESDEDADGVQLLPLSSSPPAPVAADADAPTPGDGDAEDELEAELAQALESQEVGVAGGSEMVGVPAGRVESSSESEEE